MMRIPSVGLIEIVILAAVAGLALLAGGLVLVLVIRRQRGRSHEADAPPGPKGTTARPSNRGLWLLLAGLVALLLLPLVVIVGGILVITPVRSTQTIHQEPAPAVHVVEMSTPMGPTLSSTPADMVGATTESGEGLVE
ncbi:MAG: hypothetical protein PVI80_23145, partial [Anaerolineae bacterium]